MSKKTLWIGLPIVVFWMVVTVVLVTRSRTGGEAAASSRGSLSEPTDTWLVLRAGRDEAAPRIGYIHLQQIPEARHGREGLRLELAVDMTLELFGRTTGLEIGGSAWTANKLTANTLTADTPTADTPTVSTPTASSLTNDAPTAEIAFRVRSGDSDFRLDGDVRGGRLRGTVTSAGETIPLELPVKDELMFSGGFGSALSFPKLEVGEEVQIETFDPLTLRATKATVRRVGEQDLVVGGEVFPTHILRVDAGGLRSRAWIDEAGDVVRAETALGLTLERSTAAEALMPAGAPATDGGLSAAGEFLRLTAIQPAGERPFRGAQEMTFLVRGDLPESDLPQDQTQRLRSSFFRTYQILAGGDVAPENLDSEGEQPEPPEPPEPPDASALSADVFVQSDHPKIRAAAASILSAAGFPATEAGDSRSRNDSAVTTSADPRARAEALYRWVYSEVEKTPVLSLPSALDVLAQMQGDCNEHAVLYTALARASGLPTRIAIGVVWSDDLGGFYYHAWPEVWLGDRWLWIDPTLGQPVADATHIKLLNGGIERWSQLVPYLGRLEIEVLQIR